MGRKPKKEEKPRVNPDLDGFNVDINEFGEITSTYDLTKLNEFLDKNVDDKKFRGVEVQKRKELETSVEAEEEPLAETDADVLEEEGDATK
jgi:hypothetical protein